MTAPSTRAARALVLQWIEDGAIPAARVDEALAVAGATPSVADWRRFADRLLLWSGATLLSIAVIFFFAYNWNDLGKFAQFGLVEVLIVAAIAAYWRLGVDRDAGKAALLAASILMGALLALVGQTYQTGADTFQLFAAWAALILPWVVVGRFAALWIVWVGIVNLAIALYLPMSSIFSRWIEPELWALFLFNAAALAVWEAAARRVAWLGDRWAVRIVALASAGLATTLALDAVFDSQQAFVTMLVYAGWLGAAYAVYRRAVEDLFMLAAACLSAIVVATALLAKVVLQGRDVAGGFLLISLAVIGMSAGAAMWLRSIAAERDV